VGHLRVRIRSPRPLHNGRNSAGTAELSSRNCQVFEASTRTLVKPLSCLQQTATMSVLALNREEVTASGSTDPAKGH